MYYSKKAKNVIAIGGERLGDSSQEYEPKEILQLDKDDEVIAS
jgi:hypothetical protein